MKEEKYYDYNGSILPEIIEDKMKELADKMCYKYRNISWLKRAFYTEKKFESNEEKYANSPMGTLGDSVLSIIITEALFDKEISSKDITNEKAEKENNEKWYEINNQYGLYRFAYNNKYFYDDAPEESKLPNAKHNRYFEALIAAVYKDLGFEETRNYVTEFLSKQ